MTEAMKGSLLIEEVQARYAVGSQYAQAYLNYWFQTRNRTYQTLEAILGAPQPEPMWFDFAMFTNWRGDQMAQLVRPLIPRDAERYLDVGCGFGGFLVAFSRLGLEAYGIELDPSRVELAKANCLDIGLTRNVYQKSVLDDDLKECLGKFDVITCIDVIEHVLDVPKTLSNMISLLNPGGVLVLKIPNKDALGFVAADGHFGLFGITQLAREEAMVYHKRFFGFDYDVGDYYELDYYKHRLERLGCSCQMLESSLHSMTHTHPISLLWLKSFWDYFKFFATKQAKIPISLNLMIQSSFLKYHLRLARDLIYRGQRFKSSDSFRQKYVAPFWTIAARKVT